MKLRKTALSLIEKTRTGKEIIANQRYRIVLSAAAGFAFNLLYALYHGVVGIMNLSLWFLTMCAFYGILATTRFAAILCERKNKEIPCDGMEKFVMKLSGILLTVLSFILAAVNYISMSQNIAAKHSEIIMITIAAYTFYKIIFAIIRAIKQHKNPSALLKTIRGIRYAEAAASVLTLQRSMLVSFGEMDATQIGLMNALTGAGACLFVLALGISMIITRKDVKTCQNQNL